MNSDRFDEYHSRGFGAASFGTRFDYPEPGEDRDAYDSGWASYQQHRAIVAMFKRMGATSE